MLDLWISYAQNKRINFRKIDLDTSLFMLKYGFK